MAQFLRQVLVQDETLAVSTVRTDDLPVNPLSCILVTLRCLNNTGTLTDYQVFTGLLNQISKLEVLFQGSAIVSGSLNDLARMTALLLGRGPRQLRMSFVDNDIRGVTVPILLGRRPYWMKECFPAVRRGELQLQLTSAAAQTGVDNLSLQIETVELLGATPSRFTKYTTISKTPSATGDHDVDLPIGNKLAGCLLFGTTVPTAASFNASIGQARLLLDNVEAYYARSNWETLNGELALRSDDGIANSEINVLENTAGAYAQLATSADQRVNPAFYDQYAFMDFDPLTDDSYLIETKGRARINLRITADVADAIRLLPLELVDVQGGTGAPI